ncbi:MAG: MCE family protein [Actinomycetota bacterium]
MNFRCKISSLVICSAISLVAITGCGRDKQAMRVSAIFEDVGGLVALANVQSSDVRVGRVESIRLDGYKAKVTLMLDGKADLPENVRAEIRSTSLLGEKFIDLAVPADETSNGRLSNGQVIPVEHTARVPGLDDVLQRLGSILEGGDVGDLGTFVGSAASIVRGKEQALGDVFARLRTLTDTIAPHSGEIATAVDNLNTAFASLSADPVSLGSAIDSTARATQVLSDQQKDLGRLVDSLSRFASAASQYSQATTDSSDRALKDLRAVLDQVMTRTNEIEQSLSALSRFTQKWPEAIPGWYVQLDTVAENANSGPRAYGVGTSSVPSLKNAPSKLRDLIWGPHS